MGLETHIARRGSRYYFRLRLPKDIARCLGITELKRGLGTCDPSQAKIRASFLRHRAYQGFKAIRENAMLEPEKIAKIAHAFFEQNLDQDDEFRAKSKGDTQAQRIHDSLKHNRTKAISKFESDIADGDHSAVHLYLDSAIAEEKLDVAKGSKDYYQLGQALMRAVIEAYKRMLARDGGDFRDIPSDPLIRVGALVSN
ncbi:MAG: hypothetical protein HQL44_07625, partial [Alphaproteobacteria bacterium]|nr:hypothetical protein [Alphaproteobacteria bacterium]